MNAKQTIEMAELKSEFEKHWESLIDQRYTDQNQIGSVIAYAARGSGKRVRPLLCILVNNALMGSTADSLSIAAAIELIHTYSLVHDDLPCMDDDDMRRGRESTHKRFSEESALLAGDGMLTDAFSIIASSGLDSEIKSKTILEIADAAGSNGMVLGQALDLYWTQRAGPTKEDLDQIHLLKTGYLLGAACACGALAAGANSATVTAMREFGRKLGLAFQITDDLIDASDGTGKTSGKDAASGKLTYLAMMNKDDAQRAAEILTNEANSLLTSHIQHPDILIKFSTKLLERNS
jgi:geranylgeranyl diphosphate synthase, type II